jgi:hypothetical protein
LPGLGSALLSRAQCRELQAFFNNSEGKAFTRA